MSDSGQSDSVAIWIAIITVIGGIIVAFINLNGSSSNSSPGSSPIESVCVESEFSTQGDNAPINCSN